MTALFMLAERMVDKSHGAHGLFHAQNWLAVLILKAICAAVIGAAAWLWTRGFQTLLIHGPAARLERGDFLS